jgi:hypothetical protein
VEQSDLLLAIVSGFLGFALAAALWIAQEVARRSNEKQAVRREVALLAIGALNRIRDSADEAVTNAQWETVLKGTTYRAVGEESHELSLGQELEDFRAWFGIVASKLKNAVYAARSKMIDPDEIYNGYSPTHDADVARAHQRGVKMLQRWGRSGGPMRMRRAYVDLVYPAGRFTRQGSGRR